MPDPQPDTAQGILEPLTIPKEAKAAAWDVYQVADRDTFEKRLGALPLPKEIKAKLWDSKYGTPAQEAPAPAPTAAKDPRITTPNAAKPASLKSDSLLGKIGRATYAELPMMGATIGAGLASAPFIAGAPFTAGASAFAAPTAGLVGAGAGGLIAHGVQRIISSVTGLDAPIRSAGDEATAQMTGQVAGEGVGAVLGEAARGILAKAGLDKGIFRPPAGSEAAAALEANSQVGLGLSTPEILGGPAGRIAQYAGTRSTTGQVLQRKIRDQGDKAAANAVGRVLDQFSTPTTEVGASDATQKIVQGLAGKASKRLEGAITTKLAPATGTATTGQIAREGAQAARRGLDAVQGEFGKIVDEGPDLDIRSVKDVAWQRFRSDVLPTLLNFPSMGPNTQSYKLLQKMNLAKDWMEAGPELARLLESDPILSGSSPMLRAYKRILTAKDTVPFRAAANMRSALRESGKAPDELLGSTAQGFSTHLATQMRKVMADAHPAWDAAAAAYGPDARDFHEKLVEGLIGKDPEVFLKTLTSGDGQIMSTRVRSLGHLLLGTATKSAQPGDAEVGKKAWDTVRSEWMRRNVFQGDVFGLADRIKKVDPEVLRAWFPDAAGKDVLQRAVQAGGQFESTLLRDLATKDPATLFAHVGATPDRIRETRDLLMANPQVSGPQTWGKLQRAKVQEFVGVSPADLPKMADRIKKVDPDELDAWFPKVAAKGATVERPREVLDDLTTISRALSRRTDAPMSGMYKAIEFAHVGGSILTGKVGAAMSALGLYEGVPALITASVYSPTLRKLLVQGVTAKDPKVASALLFRVLDSYAQSKKAQDDKQAATKGVPQ